MKFSLAVFLASILYGSLCSGQQEKLYVKPSEGDTDCPHDGSPCFTLKEYVNNSNFTSNRIFLFLKGKHHLEMRLYITDEANLSLVGESSGVQIICKFPTSGMTVTGFSWLIIEKITISGCDLNTVLYLGDGSDARLSDLEIYSDHSILTAARVRGLLSISNSKFSVSSSRVTSFSIIYENCTRNSNFVYSNNTLFAESGYMFTLLLKCDVDVVFTDSFFENSNKNSTRKLTVNIDGWTDSFLLFNNSVVSGATISIDDQFSKGIYCAQNFLFFSGLTMLDSKLAVKMRCHSPVVNIISTIFEHSSTKNEVVDIFCSSRNGTMNVTFTNVTFTNNNAVVLNVLYKVSSMYNSCTFENNTGTAIMATFSEVLLYNNCKFKSNNGTAVQVQNAQVFVSDYSSFESNNGTAIQAQTSEVFICNNSSFENNVGTAILAHHSEVFFQGHSTFRNNSDTFGGAIQLRSFSYMHLQENTSILFVGNHANYVGGAIYIDHVVKGKCFFNSSSKNVQVLLVNNTANFSGSAMYGNGIMLCCEDVSCSNFRDVFDIFNTEDDPSAISSDPYKLCLCDKYSSQPNCSLTTHSIEVFPGQDFPIRLAVVGTVFNGTSQGVVRAFSNSDLSVIQSSQSLKKIGKPYCQNLYYSINSSKKSETFSLTIDTFFISSITDKNTSQIDVIVNLKDCPQGFNLSSEVEGCVCHPDIEKYTQCNINNQSFLLPPNSWIEFGSALCREENCVVFSPNCPIGYCTPEYVSMTSDSPDKPCASNRTGSLCGKCDKGYSLSMGSQACWECSNTYLLLVLPMALAGLLLVVILFLLNITVTEGTINGLLFYANIIGMHHRALFVSEKSYLYPFIAWINLDFGFDVCFYDGMNYFQEAWLQFVFPIYLWAIILGIIQLFRRFPSFAAKLGGENAVPVLATLLLMSFTKLMRTVATILTFTRLSKDKVWFYDANLKYFEGQHIFLGFVGIFFIVFFIFPYVTGLTFFQQLQACSGRRLFRWVNKLKPVFDAYAGPYKDRYRFWTGMLLLVRTILFLVFIFTESINVDLLVTVIVSFALAVINSNGIYQKWQCSYLESFFFCQLGVFAAGVAYFKHSGISITAFSDISFGVSLLVFLGIVGYHGYLRFQEYRHRQGYNNIVEDDLDLVESRI